VADVAAVAPAPLRPGARLRRPAVIRGRFAATALPHGVARD
jgi:hypothetical protein